MRFEIHIGYREVEMDGWFIEQGGVYRIIKPLGKEYRVLPNNNLSGLLLERADRDELQRTTRSTVGQLLDH